MIVNPRNFKPCCSKKAVKKQNHNLQKDRETIEATGSAKSLGITVDDKLNFGKYISNLCTKS